MRYTITKKAKVLDRFKGRCAYCGVKTKKMTVDHILPIALGGTYHTNNLYPSCSACNRCKSNSTVEEFRKNIETRLLVHSKKGRGYLTWKNVLDRFKMPVRFYFEKGAGNYKGVEYNLEITTWPIDWKLAGLEFSNPPSLLELYRRFIKLHPPVTMGWGAHDYGPD